MATQEQLSERLRIVETGLAAHVSACAEIGRASNRTNKEIKSDIGDVKTDIPIFFEFFFRIFFDFFL